MQNGHPIQVTAAQLLESAAHSAINFDFNLQ